MSLALALLAALLAVNPPRVRSALPDEDRVRIGALGAVACLAALAVVAALADPLVGGLHLIGSTVRMATGAVLGVQGAAVLFLRPPAPEPRLAGRAAALVPIAFPVLLTPGLGLLALSASLDRSAPVAVVVLAAGLATVPLVAPVRIGAPGSLGPRLLRAASVVCGGGLVLAGVALLVNGLFDL